MIPNDNLTQTEMVNAADAETSSVVVVDETETDFEAAAKQVMRTVAVVGANIVLGSKGKPLAPGPLNIGMLDSIVIPEVDQQYAGFAVEQEAVPVLIQQFPQFKTFVKLADK